MIVQSERRPNTAIAYSGLEKPIWVTPATAIRISGIRRTRLYELLKNGTLKSIKLGGKRLISYASIEALGE